jgi:hypothetical protein
MNELYPIIRRKRRPLLEADAPPVVVANGAAVQAVMPPAVVESVVKQIQPQTSDAKVTSKRSAR